MSNKTEIDNSNLISSALQKTAPSLYLSVDGGDSWREGIAKRGARVKKYRSYERGDHDSDLTAQMRKMLRINTSDTAELKEFNVNYCRIVVDKMAGRLHVSEIAAKDDTVDKWIAETMERNRYDAREGELFRGAIRDADSYVIVDPQTAMWASEPAYDGYSGVVVIFNTMTAEPIWACKLWSVADSEDLAEDVGAGDTIRIVVYQKAQISYWMGQAGGAEVKPNTPPEGTKLVAEINNAIEWPLGKLPVVHFVNAKDNYNPYGESELRAVISPQNALNRTLHSMIMASELSAFRIIWTKGMELSADGIVPGSILGMLLKDSNGRIATDLDEMQIKFLEAVDIGELEATDMDQYTVQMDKLVREISQVSQTPIYGITAQGNLSGEALKQLEIGLLGKVYRFQRENTDSVRALLQLTSEIQNTFTTEAGNAPKLDGVSVGVNWKSPEIVDVSAQIEVLSKLRTESAGLWADEWYRKRIGGLLGMTQKQIKEEGEKAQNQQSLNFLNVTGGGGGPPTVV